MTILPPKIPAGRCYEMTEDTGRGSLQTYVLAYMEELRLWGYHPHRSQLDRAGWPDWVIIGPAGMLFRELKTERATLRPAQRDVGARITRAGGNWAVWQPRDLLNGVILRQLTEISGVQGELFT